MRFDKHTVLADDSADSQSTDCKVHGTSRALKLISLLKSLGQLSKTDRELLGNVLRKKGIDYDAAKIHQELMVDNLGTEGSDRELSNTGHKINQDA